MTKSPKIEKAQGTLLCVKRKRPGVKIDINYFFDRSIPEPNSGCWIWIGAISNNGYARVRTGGRTISGHRLAYESIYGPMIGSDACHKCDVRCCVNPDHVFMGSRSDNMRDCSNKGRIRGINVAGLSGEQCPSSKLTRSEVDIIRSDSRSARSLAKVFGVDRSTIGHIRRGLTWRGL
jgi:hypothetical protein